MHSGYLIGYGLPIGFILPDGYGYGNDFVPAHGYGYCSGYNFFRGYGYGIELPGGYIPVAIPTSVWRACVCVEGAGISPEPPTSPSAASALPSAPDLALGKAL